MVKNLIFVILLLQLFCCISEAEIKTILLDDFASKINFVSDAKYPEYTRISLPGGSTANINNGCPEIPGYPILFRLPQNAVDIDIKVVIQKTQSLVLAGRIFPKQPDTPLNGQLTPPFYFPDSVFYEYGERFPNDPLRNLWISAQGDSLLVSTMFYPIALEADGKTLSLINSAVLLINYRLDHNRSCLKPVGRQSKKYLLPGEERFTELLAIMPEDSFQHLIITHQQLKSAFLPLVHWRTITGLPSQVQTTEWIQTHVPGVDLAEKIRNYIKACWLYCGTRYVLLGGDTQIIPERQIFYADPYLPNNLLPSDLYYSDIIDTTFAAGFWQYNFNRNGNLNYGELPQNCGQNDGVDQTPDLFIGRAPVTNAYEAAIFVSKTISYEKSSLPDHTERLLIMTDGNFAWFGEQANQIVSTQAPWIQSHRMYNPQSGSYYSGQELLTVPNGLNRMDQGFGLIYHFDHGSPYALSLAKDHSSMGGGWIYRPQVVGLGNAPRYSIMISPACSPNAFDYSSIAEAFLKDENGGLAAFIGNSRVGWTSQYPQFNEFFQSIFRDSLERLGQVFNRMVDVGSPYAHYALNLLGDPALRISRRQLLPLSASIPHKWEITTSNLTISVGSLGYQQTRVQAVISQNGRILASKFFSAPGHVDFYSNELWPDSGFIQVAIWARDHLPFIDSCYVAGTCFHLAGYELDDGQHPSGLANGNSDGVANPGETVRLLPKYQGNIFRITLSCSDPMITLQDTVWILNHSNECYTTSSRPAFRISISPEIYSDRRVLLNFCFQGASDSLTFCKTLPLEVATDSLILASAVYRPAPPTNERSRTYELTNAVIQNCGSGSARNVRLLSGNLPVQLGDIPANGQISISQAIPLLTIFNGHDTIATLILQDGYGRTRNLNVVPYGLPQIPYNISSRSGPGSILLRWNYSDGKILGFNIYRKQRSKDNFVKINQSPVAGLLYQDDKALPLYPYLYAVSAISKNGREGPLSVEIEAAAGPMLSTGFPIALGMGNTATRQWTSPVSGDINRDGQEEIVLGSDDGSIYVFDHQGCMLPGWPKDLGSNPYGRQIIIENSSPALADLDGDGCLDIIMGNGPWYGDVGDGLVHAWRYDGSEITGWPQSISGNVFAPVSVDDINSDGWPEVIAVSSHGWLYVWDHHGNLLPGWPVQIGVTRAMSSAALGDLNGNGEMEVVASANDGGNLILWVLNKNGQPLPGWPKILQTGANHVISSPAMADMDGDGTLEIIQASEMSSSGTSQVYVLRYDGSNLNGWPFIISNYPIISSPALSDLDNDGRPEVVLVSGDGTLYSISHNDGPYINWSAPLPPNGRANPIIADINGDGELDVVASAEDGYLRAYRGRDGQPLSGFPLWMESSWSAPLVSDVDKDGRANLVAYGWGSHSLHVWDLPSSVNNLTWRTIGGDICHTNRYKNYDDRMLSSNSKKNALPSYVSNYDDMLKPISPNPCRHQAIIEYSISQNQDIEIAVYNLLGQKIATLAREKQQPGHYQILWNLKSSSGRKVSSGVYLIRFKSPTIDRRMKLMVID